jgi:hypothetical protein
MCVPKLGNEEPRDGSSLEPDRVGMSFTSSSALLDWLSQNLFLNPQQVDELRAFVASEPNVQAFCKELLRRNWLTSFQVSQLVKHGGETLVLGANRLHSRIGEGAMGQVYKAWNVRLGRMVAVKMLRSERALSGKAIDRFRREMQTAAALDHPNIVLLRDADESKGVPFLVMDFFEGVDLAAKLRSEGPQSIKQATEYVLQASLGLQHAFERGVVHRDIKPSNLLLVKTSDGGEIVKILDFGLAKFEVDEDGAAALTQEGRLIGTVDFMAPEQALDAHNADIRADIYSLGCALFFLLTGKPPFADVKQLDKLTARIQGEPPRLRDHRAEAHAELEAVLLKMMDREPANRFQTPREVVAALSPFCREAPLAAPIIPAVPERTASSIAPEVAPAAEPEFLFEAPARDAAAAATALAPPRKKQAAEAPAATIAILQRPLVMVAVGAAILLALGTGAYWMFVRSTPALVESAAGTMTLSLDTPPDKIWAWNDRKPIIVKVVRHDFTGPVTLACDNLPPWMQCNPVTIGPARNEGQLVVLVRFHDQLGPFTMKIAATAAGSQPAFIDYAMEIVPVHAPKGG